MLFARVRERAEQAHAHSAHIVFRDPCTHLETPQHIDLCDTLSLLFGLAQFNIQTAELPIDGRFDHQVLQVLAQEAQVLLDEVEVAGDGAELALAEHGIATHVRGQ